MSVLSWGKPTIRYVKSTNGAPGSSWSTLDTPEENTTTLETTEGDSKEAKEEGGAIVDATYNVSDYSLKFTLYVKKDESGTYALPLGPQNGKVADEYAFQVIPEDANCAGLQIDKSRVTVATTYSSEGGIKLQYTCRALLPADEEIVKVKKITI